MLKYTVYNLVKFAVALLRAGRGLKWELQLAGADAIEVALLRAERGLKLYALHIGALWGMSPCFAQGVD